MLLGYPDINMETHGGIIHALESPSERKLIVVPRGCLKSTIASVAYPIWMLLKNPDLRIMIDSELYSNSKNFLREIKAHLESEPLTNLFGQFKTDKVWNEGEITIGQRKKPLKESSITCSGVGAQKTSQHFDLIICDDLSSPTNSHTPESREKVINHYRMYTSLLDPGGICVVIGTRYHQADIIGWILENELTQNSDGASLSKMERINGVIKFVV